MKYTDLSLVNFTVFRDAEFHFEPGINVFVGENGTGKTHLLKILYSFQEAARHRRPLDEYDTDETGRTGVDGTFAGITDVFRSERSGSLISAAAPPGSQLSARATFDQGVWSAETVSNGFVMHFGSSPIGEAVPRSVLIPAVDMLGHTRRFLTTWDEYRIDFDRTYRDIVSLLLSPERRHVSDLGVTLSDLTGGQAVDIEERDERFYITTTQGEIAAPMVAEGVRKLATLVQLIRNGWVRPGTTLFWDEPEAGINPGLMQPLANALLRLAAAGVQIFLATHSYVLLKEFDLQAPRDSVAYIALRPEPDGVKSERTLQFSEINPNKIADEFDSLYDRELTRAMGKARVRANGR